MSWTELGSSWLGGWFRGTRARERSAWRVPDHNRSAIDACQWLTTYIANVCRKKRCQLFENCANFARVQFSQSLIFATIGGFVRLNIRFASLTRRAFVASAPNQFAPWSREVRCVCWTRWRVCVCLWCLLDTMASMCLPMVFVGHGINKCLQWYAPGMYECLRDNIWAIAHMPRWVITS